MHFTKPSLTSFIAYLLMFLSLCMIAFSIYSLIRVDVLREWSLELPNSDIHAGDTIIVQSKYKKLMEVDGDAEHYIDCDSTSGARLSYLLNKREANRAPGKRSTAVEITLPTNITSLPAECSIRIVVKYRVIPFKETVEINQTKDFTLLPSPGAGSAAVIQSTTQTNPVPALGVSHVRTTSVVRSSSIQNTQPAQPVQSNTVQPQPTQPTTNTPDITNNPPQEPEQQCVLALLGLNVLCI